MIHPVTNSSKDVRGVFIIDPDDHISAFFFYPDNVGRNLDEIKRTLLALQATDGNNILTPANWLPGQEVLLPSPKTVKEAGKRKESYDSGIYQLTWYMWFKKMK